MRMNSHSTKVTLLTLSIVCVLAVLIPTAWGEVCEFPLAIQRTMANGNVLFILDNSGSMNEIVYHDEYNRDMIYDGPFTATDIYTVKQDGTYNPSDFIRELETEPNIYLVNSDNSVAGRYLGNYLNWLFYHATAEQIATMPLITRIQAEKAVISDVVIEFNPDELPTGTIRFGVMKFNSSGAGGTIISKIGSPREELLNQVEGVSANAPTPLAETMVDAIEYLSLTGNLAPIEYSCQKTFIILLTDGYPTEDLNIPSHIGDYDGDGKDPGNCESIGAPYSNSYDCSDYLDDVAAYLHDIDLRPEMPEKQNACTYVVGFNIDAPILAETAANGDGLYLTANNVTELKAALKNVLRDIIRRISSGSAVAIVSVEGESEDHLLRAKYLPVKWHGYLEAFALPYENDNRPIWEAGELLAYRSADSRHIFTSLGGQQIEFVDNYADHLYRAMELPTPDEAADVISWVRGENVPGLRDRSDWKLGDIVDSSPVVVGPPSSFYLEEEYMSFRKAYADRVSVVYIGANDGMLHAFNESTGHELWSFIPESQLPRLKNLADSTYCHEYFLNLTPTVVDVRVHGYWRTVLLCGMKQGGNGYFALDVTDPKYPHILWESQVPNVIESWIQPEIVKTKGFEQTVAIIGSGPDYATGKAHAMAISIEDDSVLWSEMLSSHQGVNMATAAETIDLDYDGYEDLIYISDLAGHVWRYDLTHFPPEKSLLFETNQPIQAKPVVTLDYNSDAYIYFGTGKYIDPLDIFDTSLQSFYCIIDNHSLTTVSRSDLVDQTSSIHELTSDDRGWYIDLVMGAGERVVEPDAIIAEVVYFTSFKPMSEMCEFGGFSWFYAVDFRTGAAHNDDDTENGTTEGRTEEIGEGIASRPVVDIVNENIVIQGSDTSIHFRNTLGVIKQLIIRSWRPIYH